MQLGNVEAVRTASSSSRSLNSDHHSLFRATLRGLLVAIGLGLLISACNRAEDEIFDPQPAVSHYDAASTHIAVISVAPWTDQVDRLQPNFRLDGETALTKTLPVTQLLTNQVLDALNASLQVALPSFTETRTETVTSEARGSAPATETRNVTEEERSGPGEIPALPDDAAMERKAADLPSIDLDASRLKREAIIEYQTATALFQEVQLLNSYVRNAARRTGYTPYLVRLQLTVLPNGRNRPYDVVADVGFLPPQKTTKEPTGGIPGVLSRTESAKQDPSAKRVPIVVPLLVTDTIELSLQSRALEILRQFRFALSGQFQNIGVQAGLGRTKDEIATALGNDLNAISTIGRLNESTVRVRLGAVNQASARFAMVPRANTVSLLVLVPSAIEVDTRLIMPVALRTRLRDAKTGAMLPDVAPSEKPARDAIFTDIATTYRIKDGIANPKCLQYEKANDLVWALSQFATQGDYARFYDCASTLSVGNDSQSYIKNEGLFDSLWTEVGALSAGYGYSTTEVELPPVIQARLPHPSSLALLLDDRKLRATTRLTGASGFAAGEVQARLLLDNEGKEVVVATGIERRGGDIILTFPSLALWSIAIKGQKDTFTLPKDSKLEVALPGYNDHCVYDESNVARSCLQRYSLRYLVRATDPEPAFTVATSVSNVAIEEKGLGLYTFGLGSEEGQPVTLIGDGAVVTAVEPGVLAKDGISWVITRPGRIAVRLAQLTSGQAFKLRLTDAGGLAREISITAKALAPEVERQTGGGRS